MSGQQIGTVVGGIVGAFFGMPQLGMAIGGLIGGAIDPEVIKGPHIGDGAQQSAQEGIPIPWVLGIARVQGNIVQKSDRREVKKTEGGKGGPEVVTYEAHQDFAIMVCESSETRDSTIVGVQMVFCNGKLLYDTRPSSNFQAENSKFLRNCTFYFGAENQMPDPTLEIISGVGNTPAYRGVFTAVFRDINLSQYGDAIPTYEWVVVSDGTTTFSEEPFLPGRLAEFQDSHFPLADTPETDYEYSGLWASGLGSGVTSPTFNTIGEVLDYFSDVNSDDGDYPGVNNLGAPSIYVGYIADTGQTAGDYITSTKKVDIIAAQPTATNLESLLLLYQWVGWTEEINAAPDSFCPTLSNGSNWIMAGNGSVVRRVAARTSLDYQLLENCDNIGYGPGYLEAIYPLCIQATRKRIAPIAPEGTAIPDAPDYYVDANGDIFYFGGYNEIAGTFKVLSIPNTTGTDPSVEYSRYEIGPAVISGDPNYSNSAFWTAAYNAAVVAGSLPAGWVYDNQYPVVVSSVYQEPSIEVDLQNNVITVADAITRICARGGVPSTQIDVSEVDQTLTGYPIANDYNAADDLSPLCVAYSLYGSEYDGKIHFRKHGADVDVSINTSDLIYDSDQSDEATRSQAKEYPRKILLNYIDIDQDFAVRPQTRQSITPDVRSIGEETMQVAVVMDGNQAAQLVDIFYKRSRASVNGRRKFSIPFGTNSACYLERVAGEPIGFDGKRYMIDQMTISDGEIAIEATYDRQSAYTSDVSGIPAVPPTPAPSTLNGPTLFSVMSLPQLRDQDQLPGVYIAVRGLLDSWRGCQLLMSRDDGATWLVAFDSMITESVMGNLRSDFAVNILDSNGDPILDSSGGSLIDTIEVSVHGELDSITQAQFESDQITAHMNAAAVVNTDRTAEIVRFRDASQLTDTDYDLTTLARGIKETDIVDHAAGDEFVMLDKVYFLPMQQSDVGMEVLFKPVSFGSSPDSAPEYAITIQEVTYIINGGGEE